MLRGMKIIKKGILFSGLLCVVASMVLCGCGNNQTQPAPPPPTTLTAQEQQAVDNFKNLSPSQQQAFLKSNPKLAQNPLVIAEMRDSLMKKR